MVASLGKPKTFAWRKDVVDSCKGVGSWCKVVGMANTKAVYIEATVPTDWRTEISDGDEQACWRAWVFSGATGLELIEVSYVPGTVNVVVQGTEAIRTGGLALICAVLRRLSHKDGLVVAEYCDLDYDDSGEWWDIPTVEEDQAAAVRAKAQAEAFFAKNKSVAVEVASGITHITFVPKA